MHILFLLRMMGKCYDYGMKRAIVAFLSFQFQFESCVTEYRFISKSLCLLNLFRFLYTQCLKICNRISLYRFISFAGILLRMLLRLCARKLIQQRRKGEIGSRFVYVTGCNRCTCKCFISKFNINYYRMYENKKDIFFPIISLYICLYI